MLIFYFIILLAFCLLIYYFVSTNLYPVPYFPTNTKDLNKVINALNLKNGQTVIDLGAGTGKIIFESAKAAHIKKLGTEFVAIDRNLLLVAIMFLRRFFHPHKKHIQIVWSDFFRYDFKKIINKKKDVVIYIYLAPWLNTSIGNLVKKLRYPMRIVSYYYPINNLKLAKKISGEHGVFVYDIK